LSAYGISCREFAHQSGCNEKQVRRAISSGKLKRNEDGSLDPSQIETGWRRPTRSSRACADKIKTSAPIVRSDEHPSIIAARIVTGAMELLPLAEAIRITTPG